MEQRCLFDIVWKISFFWIRCVVIRVFGKRHWQPFVDLVNSKRCTNVRKLLIFSDLQKVANTIFKYEICLLKGRQKHVFKQVIKNKCQKTNVKNKLRIQGRMQMLIKVFLNRVLTLPDYSGGPESLNPSRFIDLQNENSMLVAKQWKIKFQ